MRNRTRVVRTSPERWGRDQCDPVRRGNEESRGNCFSRNCKRREQRENDEQLPPVKQELLIRPSLDFPRTIYMWINFPQTKRRLRSDYIRLKP
jgi:hypothetical protein